VAALNPSITIAAYKLIPLAHEAPMVSAMMLAISA
jgi:hypothetical protein